MRGARRWLAALAVAGVLASTASVPLSTAHAADTPLTASFAGVPSAHDGVSPFSFDLVFSEPASVGYAALRDDSFDVTGATVTGARRVDGRSDRWRITVAPDVPTLTDAVGDVSIELAATSDCDDTGAVCTADDAKALSNTTTATVAAPPALTAAFEGVPATHDTSAAFSFRLRFNTAVTTSYRILGDTAFDVTGGSVTGARRVDGRSDLWQISIQPDAVDDDTVDDDISITLPATTDCGDADAVCTVALRPLSEPVTAAVEGPLVEAEPNTGGRRVTRGIPGDKEDEEEDRVGVRALPGRPGSLEIQGGNEQVTVSWDAVTSDPAVTAYVVQYRVGDNGPHTMVSRGDVLALSETITGRTNYERFRVQVYAVNDEGTSGTRGTTAMAVPTVPLASANAHATDISGDGTTLWVADTADNMSYAYTKATGARNSSLDFDYNTAHVHAAGQCLLDGFFWIADSDDDHIYAYNKDTRVHDTTKSFDLHDDNANARGVACRDGTIWVADSIDKKMYAYGTDGARDSDSDITLDSSAGVGNGAWTDGTTMWISDTGGRLRAYDVAAGTDLTTDYGIASTTVAGLSSPSGVWSDDTDLWITDIVDNLFYKFELPQRAAAVAPGVPTSVASVGGSDGSVTVTWGVPASDGGTAITSYDLRYKKTADDEAASWSTQTVSDPTTRSFAIGGLDLGVSYDVQVRADNGTDGEWSTSATAETGRDFALGTARPYDLTSDGTTVWVTDGATRDILAYSLSNGALDDTKDFETVVANNNPTGICWHTDTFWVAQSGGTTVYAYNNDGTRNSDRDIALPTGTDPRGLSCTDRDMQVVDDTTDTYLVYVRNHLGTDELWVRSAPDDVDPSGDSGSDDPIGVWSADSGSTFVSDVSDTQVYAHIGAAFGGYRLRYLEFDLVSANDEPAGMWSDGTTMWVLDRGSQVAYGYRLPVGTDGGPAPLLAIVQPDRLSAQLAFNENLDRNVTPAAGAFEVTAGSDTITPSSIAHSVDEDSFAVEDSVTLTFSPALPAGETLTIAYTAPTSTDPAIQDAGGVAAESFSGFKVINRPSAPQNVAAAPGDTSLTVTWEAPAGNGGKPLTSYRVRYKLSTATTWTTVTRSDVLALTETITGLTNDLEYDIEVTASNYLRGAAAEVSATPAAPTNAVPDAPTGVHVSGTLGSTASVDVGWTAPTNTDIDHYKLQYRESGDTDWINGPQDVSGRSATIASLSANTTYEVQVRANNSDGDGAWSTTATGHTNAVQPADSALVSNRSQSGNQYDWPLDVRTSQAFTTGSEANGYDLSSLNIRIRKHSGSTRGLRVRMYSDSGGDPGAHLFTFSNPSTIPVGVNDLVFTAPSGTRLAASTTYHLVVARSGGSGTNPDVRLAESNDETGASNWSIADLSQYFDGISQWVNQPNSASIIFSAQGRTSTDMPYITDIEVEDAPGDGLGYEEHDVITVSVTFSEAVDVIGNPRFPVRLNTGDEQAVYTESREMNTVLDFDYTVGPEADEHDNDGFVIWSNRFHRNGGAIKRAGSSTVDADLDKPYHSPGSDYTINATSATGVEMESTPRTVQLYAVGDHIEFKVTFNGAVDVTGTPQFAFCLNNSGQDCNETQADYNRGSGTTELIFRYEVQSGDSDNNGIYIDDNPISLNSGTITKQGDDDRHANLAIGRGGTQTAHKVFNGPVIRGLAVTSRPRYSDDTYTLGEDIEVTVTFSEAVDVASDPIFLVKFESSGFAKEAAYDRGTGTEALVFAYTVQAGDTDADGIDIKTDDVTFRLDSNDSIKRAGSDVDATLAHAALGELSDHKVKTSDNPPKFPSTETGERSVAENSPAGTAVGAPFTATDADSDTLVFSLGGDDAASFTIGSSSGQISTITGVTYDYEVKITYSLTVSVTDGTYTDTVDVAITLTDIDETDATLSALTLVEGSNSVTLSPSFASGTTDYRAWVANGVSSVTVTATKNDDEASVAITGDSDTSTPNTAVVSLAEGANTITVTVTAADTTTTGTYTITAVREASAPTADPTALLTAKMTVAQKETADTYGYQRDGANYGALTGNEFEFNDVTYTITNLFWNGPQGEISLGLNELILCFRSLPRKSVYNNWTLRVGSVDYVVDENPLGTSRCLRWFRTARFAHGEVVTVKMFGNQAATGAPGVSGAAQVGQTLTALTAGIVDLDGTTNAEGGELGFAYGYQWVRVDSDGTNPVDISGATSVTYVPVKADVGKKVMVEVTFTDDRSNEEELTSAAYPAAGRILNDVPPMLDTATVNGVSLVLTYDRELDGDSDPAVVSYTVAVAGAGVTPMGVDAAGRTVTLTLATAVTSGQSVTLDYMVPDMSPVQDSDGTPAGALDGQAVHNVVGDTTVPTLGSARVDGDVLVLSYSEALDSGSEPAVGQFDVQVTPSGGSASRRTVSTVDVSGSKVTLTLASAVDLNDSVTLSYEKPTSNPLQDVAGNDAAEFNDQGVINNNQPMFAQATLTREITENTAANVNVGAVIPAATGGADGATLVYSMEGTDAASFNFNDTTRQITTKTGVTYDYETTQSYSVTIKVTDGTDNDTVTVTINVKNLPTISIEAVQERILLSDGQFTFDVKADSRPSVDLSIPSVEAQDHAWVAELTASERLIEFFSDDYAPNPETSQVTKTYTIVGGAPVVSGDFTVTLHSGTGYELDAATSSATVEIVAADPLITVRAEQAAYPVSENHGTLTVTLIAETIAGAPKPREPLQVSWAAVAGTATGGGADFGDAGGIAALGVFGESEFTAEGVRWVATMDVEVTVVDDSTWELDETFHIALSRHSDTHSLVKLANTDRTLCASGVNCGATVTILSNDNAAPEFSSTTATREVEENSPPGTEVGLPVTATDADTGDGDELTYTLEGTDRASFAIDAVTGQITTIPGVDYDFETDPSYSVTVKATDLQDASATIAVTINLTDVDVEVDVCIAPDLADREQIWTAEMTVGISIGVFTSYGFRADSSPFGSLSDDDFRIGTTNYEVGQLFNTAGIAPFGDRLTFLVDNPVPDMGAVLHVCDESFRLADALLDQRLDGESTYIWSNAGLDWSGVDMRNVYLSVTPPQLESATVNGRQLELEFSRALDTGSVPSTGDFNVQVTPEGGVAARRSVTNVAISASTATLTLSSAVLPEDTVTVQYSGQALRDTTEIKVRAFDGESVDNDTPDTTAPILESHTVSGSTLTLTYNELLDKTSEPATDAFVVNVTPTGGTAQPREVTAVVVDGVTVTLTLASPVAPGETVTVVYTVPASDPIQDEAGNDAAAINITIELTADQTGVCNRAIQDSGRCDLSTATTLTPGVPLAATVAEPEDVAERNDVDWFRVELVDGKVYRIDMEGAPTNKGTLRDPYLSGMYAVFAGSDVHNYRADGSLDGDGEDIETIWYSLHGDCAAGERSSSTNCELFDEGTYYNDDGGVGYNARLYLRDFPTGAYYVEARGLGPATGTYTITLTEVTDDAAGARTLTLSTRTSATIDFPDDSDTFEIDLTANTEYTITLRSQGWDGWSDIDIDSAVHTTTPGVEIDTPYTSSTDTYTITPATTGTHRLKIVGRNWGRHQRFATGEYTITITESA